MDDQASPTLQPATIASDTLVASDQDVETNAVKNPSVLVRRKLLWIAPLLVLVLVSAIIWILDYWLMKEEALVFEVGSGIRSRFEDFGADFKAGDGQALKSYYTESFTGTGLGFKTRQESSEEAGIVIEDWSASDGTTTNREQMTDALTAYRRQLHHVEASKFKMVFLNKYGDSNASIVLRFQVYAHDADGHPTEDRGHFNVDLLRRDGEWKIAKQTLLDGRRVIGINSKYFTDVTETLGIDFNTGVNGIFKQRKYNFAIADRTAGGVAVGDYDNDGHPDIFLAGSEGSKLYRNDGGGHFEDVTVRAGLSSEATKYAQGAVFADYNNDGCLDLYITRTPNVSNKLFKNNCNGTFTDVTKEAGLELATYSTTAAFADVDNDGYLDLYVGVYGPALEQSPEPPFNALNGLSDHLYHNNGNGTFTDITKEAGLTDSGWTLAMTFLDYDNDGNQDIYVANDFGHKVLFRNDGTGHFKDVTKQAGLVDYGFGMSASAGDYDNDGYEDIYTSNIYSGTEWYLQNTVPQFFWVRLMDPQRTVQTWRAAEEVHHNLGSWSAAWAVGKKFGEGNALYRNQGDGTFKSVGVEKQVNMGGWAWGSNFFDFDNDGDLDIHSVNGFISQKKGTDL
jgi:hypothetical protein